MDQKKEKKGEANFCSHRVEDIFLHKVRASRGSKYRLNIGGVTSHDHVIRWMLGILNRNIIGHIFRAAFRQTEENY
jgi:hypothetical protein